MDKVIVATVPHSGTHFVEKLLDLLKVEHKRIHATPANIRELWRVDKATKFVTTFRPPFDCAESLYNRVKDFRTLPELAVVHETVINFRTWRMFFQLRKENTARCIPVYKDWYESTAIRTYIIDEICKWLGVPFTTEAQAFITMWPKESTFPHDFKLADPSNVISDYLQVENYPVVSEQLYSYAQYAQTDLFQQLSASSLPRFTGQSTASWSIDDAAKQAIRTRGWNR